MKKGNIFIKTAFLLTLPLFLASCSDSVNIRSKDYAVSRQALETFYEDCYFYSVNGSSDGSSKNLLMYGYIENGKPGKTAPLCSNPNCNHNTSDFPGCGAAVDSPRGIIRDESGLYYFDFNTNGGGDIILYHSDVNGSNKKEVAVLENKFLYTLTTCSYGEDYALYIYYDMQGLDEMEEGDYTYEIADKYSAFVDYVDLKNGEVKNLITKKEHAAQILNALIYDNRLIYQYRYYTKDIRNLEEGEKMSDYAYEGIYSLDLKTGEEKHLSEEFKYIEMVKQGFDFFDPEKIICKDYGENKLYFYNLPKDEFTPIDDCGSVYNNFSADNTCIIYTSSADENIEYRFYDIESGETTVLPSLPENLRIECLVKDTIWASQINDDGTASFGYISKEDFLDGNYDNFKLMG